MKKTHIRFIIFAVLSILVLIFIFYNSTRTGEQSNETSLGLMDFILSIIDPQGKLDTKIVHFVVRKAAHFAEFFAFGLCLCGMALAVLDDTERFYASFSLLVALLAAVIDELIQSFTSRTSSVKDVLLDFAGSFTGVIIAFLIGKIRRSHKAKAKNNNKKSLSQ